MSNQTIKDRSAKIPRGKTLLYDPILNKGMAFNEAERDSSRVCVVCFRRAFSLKQNRLCI